jgi:hypothetical protein
VGNSLLRANAPLELVGAKLRISSAKKKKKKNYGKKDSYGWRLLALLNLQLVCRCLTPTNSSPVSHPYV